MHCGIPIFKEKCRCHCRNGSFSITNDICYGAEPLGSGNHPHTTRLKILLANDSCGCNYRKLWLLGLACILGFLNLTLYIFRTQKTANSITTNITELTYISEMTMTIGVFMLTIGTFLGGIWANESWGRYWGWDPKETWALVSVLVYATILHLRFIPGLKASLYSI